MGLRDDTVPFFQRLWSIAVRCTPFRSAWPHRCAPLDALEAHLRDIPPPSSGRGTESVMCALALLLRFMTPRRRSSRLDVVGLSSARRVAAAPRAVARSRSSPLRAVARVSLVLRRVLDACAVVDTYLSFVAVADAVSVAHAAESRSTKPLSLVRASRRSLRLDGAVLLAPLEQKV